MALLDRLRSRPRWQDPDPQVRADAVRQIAVQDQTLLAELARADSDPRVRRAALRRLNDARTLAELLASEVDVTAREEASDALLSWAMGEDEGAAHVALDALSDARRVQQLARSARLASVRRAALARVEDPRLLVSLAKAAEDPAVRGQALARLADAPSIIEVALRTDHRDAAMAAVDRIDDVAALERIAESARHKAACRRARARIEALRTPPMDAPIEAGTEAARADLAPTSEASSAMPVEEPATAVAPEPGPPDTEDASGAATAPPIETEAPSPAGEGADASSAADASATGPAHVEPHEPPHAEALARAQALCDRLERLVAKPALALRDADAALRDARAFQSDAGPLTNKLAPRLKAARSALFARAQELRDADEWSRWGNAAVQEALCAQLEALLGRDDFERAARELHGADARWAEFRRAPKDQAEALRQRYQSARAQLTARLDAYFERKAASEAEHLEQRKALCARAEALADSSNWLKASEELKSLQARWKEIGPAPRRQSEALWKRFRAACDRFFTRRNENLQQRKTEWSANLALKEALCARAEALSQSTDWQAAADELKRIQGEWRSVGPVRKKKSEALWQRFRAACDAFFERYKNRDALELAARRSERERLCEELESMSAKPDASDAAPDLLARVQALQARWRQAPRLPVEEEHALELRYLDARARLISTHGGAFRGSELDPEVVRSRKQKLCARVEALVGRLSETQGAALSGEALARRLMEALADNTIGGAAQAEAKRRAESEEVEAAQAAWSRLGPLHGEAGEALERRFREACARFLRERPAAAPERPARVKPRERRAGTSRAPRTP